MRTLNDETYILNNKIVLLKSDNFDYVYMDSEVYYEMTLEMSTGDYATHRAVIMYVDVDTRANLKDKNFIEHSYLGDSLEPNGYWFWNNYDATFENLS